MIKEEFFKKFRENVVGQDLECDLINKNQKILYADWVASGRLYRPIEEYISNYLGDFVANTHTGANITAHTMTESYKQAHQIIKKHVNASENDSIITSGSGMTDVVTRLQRILGLVIPENFQNELQLDEVKRPLVIITHMEHHSNQTTWEYCLCDIEIIRPNDQGLPDLNHLTEILEKNKHKELKIGSFSSCSNVTGIITPFYEMAEIIHEHGGYCFVDFSASAPYVEINMHPENEKQSLDAVFFSPHKFLGGPGSPGVLVFNKILYNKKIPDMPGGGTVLWTNPWNEHIFYDDIEVREDGGTPGFLQAIRASLAIMLKDEMGVSNILAREKEQMSLLLSRLSKIPELRMLEDNNNDRIGVVSFLSPDKPHHLLVSMLNDYFGIQVRGGCSCAGTYGHLLLDVDQQKSHAIMDKIYQGDYSDKIGWVRVSVHPVMSEQEVEYMAFAIEEIYKNFDIWSKNYDFNPKTGGFYHKSLVKKSVSLEDDYIKFINAIS